MNSTRQSLSQGVAGRLGIPQDQAKDVLEAFLSVVTDRLALGEDVYIRRWGAFFLRSRKGRDGARNPRTGEPCRIPAHRTVRFRPSKEGWTNG